MNDSELEAWLATHFRDAPNPDPGELLRRAIRLDRVRSARPAALPRRRSLLAGLAGLAATMVLIAGLVAVATSRPARPSPAANPEGPVTGIAWQPASRVASASLLSGPYLATAGGRMFLAGDDASKVQTGEVVVWSSTDGVAWSRASEPGAFDKGGPGFMPSGFSDDGQGGLVLVGTTPAADGSEAGVATVWHSPDGRTWHQSTLGTGWINAVAARPGGIVVLGDVTGATVPIANPGSAGAGSLAGGELTAWLSTDGEAWSQTTLPADTLYEARAVAAWKGGFVAFAQQSLANTPVSAVWTSADGRSWARVPGDLPGFDANAAVGFGDRVVAVGFKGSTTDLAPASESSTDGRTWAESIAPARERYVGFGSVAVVDGSLVAVGESHAIAVRFAGGASDAPSASPPASVWVSSDGAAWRLLPEDASLTAGVESGGRVVAFAGRIAFASQDGSEVVVRMGDPFSGQVSPAPSAVPTPSVSAPTPPVIWVSPSPVSLGGGECPEGDTMPALGGWPVGSPATSAGVVHIAQPEGLDRVEWSPDSRHFLLAGTTGVELFDSSGRPVSSIAGAVNATWIDSSTYATESDCQNAGTVTVHSIAEASATTLPYTYDSTVLLGSGHGALAMSPRLPDSAADPTTTVVWDGSKLSLPVPGRPLAWSPDGTRLLVTKGDIGGGGGAGAPAAIHVQLLSFPDLKVVTSFGDLTLDPRYDPLFSPDGRSIAIYCGPLTATGCSPYVFDAVTGKGTKVIEGEPSSLSWLPNGHLLVGPPSGTTGGFSEWDGAMLVASPLPHGSWAVACPAGGVVVESAPAGDVGGTSSVGWPNGSSTAGLPGAAAIYWAPDGTHVILQPRYPGDLLLVK